ncbi:MAG TPA: single-stranded DNA-binding protein [Acidimicrobiales bacterium]|nr:single-stranded DNA-binding protein [Acidimicrobiales bacterium]
MNVVVLRGRLARPSELRVLPSGDQLLTLEVSTIRPGARAESVPVVWPEAPAAASNLDVDQEVVVVGRVRRRFFRAAGRTESRTEVVADVVLGSPTGKRARAALQAAAGRLLDEAGQGVSRR